MTSQGFTTMRPIESGLVANYKEIRKRLHGKPDKEPGKIDTEAKIWRAPAAIVRLANLSADPPADQAATLPADHAATLPADNAAEVQIIPGTSVYAFASLLQDT
jgi:hypothetical protein